jgi:hypothetical protein
MIPGSLVESYQLFEQRLEPLSLRTTIRIYFFQKENLQGIALLLLGLLHPVVIGDVAHVNPFFNPGLTTV